MWEDDGSAEAFSTYSEDKTAEENMAYALYGIVRALLDVANSNREIALALSELGQKQEDE